MLNMNDNQIIPHNTNYSNINNTINYNNTLIALSNQTKCVQYLDEYSNQWSETSPSSYASIPCSEYLSQNTFIDSTEIAFKECLSNGTWSLYTNYTLCQPITYIQDNNLTSLSRTQSSNNPRNSFYDTTVLIYYAGYSLSMFSLALALIILTYFKSLRCMRNIIHCHLIVAFIMSDIMWICLHLVHMNYQMFSKKSLQISCNVVSVLYTYFFTSNFFWMFAEGIFMYQMVVVGFARKILPLKYVISIGWGIPFVLIFSWSSTNIARHGNMCLVHVGKHRSYYIYAIPIFIVLTMNFIIFLLVVKLLIEKVFFSKAGGNINYLKSFKGFIFLIPHLGIIYLLTMYSPRISSAYNKIWVPLLLSTQGFFVALYCCFMNKEVKIACTTEMKHMENRRKSSSTAASILFPSSNSDIPAILPSYLIKRFSIISNAIKRPSIQSDNGFSLVSFPATTKNVTASNQFFNKIFHKKLNNSPSNLEESVDTLISQDDNMLDCSISQNSSFNQEIQVNSIKFTEEKEQLLLSITDVSSSKNEHNHNKTGMSLESLLIK